MNKKPKIPIILYEEPKPGEAANPIPYIEVGIDEDMPKILFISQYKATGEFEVDTVHGSSEIVDMYMHKFVDLEHLQKLLDSKTYDKIRVALGMKPLKEAQKSGKIILDKVVNKAENRRVELITNEDKRKERAFVLGEQFKLKAKEFLENKKDKS